MNNFVRTIRNSSTKYAAKEKSLGEKMPRRFSAIAFALSVFCSFPGPVCAEPTSGAVHILNIRPYSGSNAVYLVTDNPNGSFCANSWYLIDLSSYGGKAMYAAALTALASGKAVQLEVANCNNPNLLQSLYILNY